MIIALVNTFVPIFAGLLLGYLAGLWKFVDNQNVRTLITFVMSVALPCSLFSTVGELSRPAVEQQGEVAAVLGITYVAFFLVVYFWAARWERLSPSGSAVLALTLSFPNMAGVGYPLLEAVHGPGRGVAAAVGLTIGSITVAPVTLAVLEHSTGNPGNRAAGRSGVRSIVKTLKKPVVWAPVLGIVFALFSIHLATYLELSLDTMGSATTGAALFLTGLVVSAKAFRLDRAVILSVLGKNIVQPAFLSPAGHGHRNGAAPKRLRRSAERRSLWLFWRCIRKEFSQRGAPGGERESYCQLYCRPIHYDWLDGAPQPFASDCCMNISPIRPHGFAHFLVARRESPN